METLKDSKVITYDQRHGIMQKKGSIYTVLYSTVYLLYKCLYIEVNNPK